MKCGQNKQGFTIVELLIVIVVIGILAAITLVAYNGIQNRANDAAVQNDMKNMATKLKLWQVDNGRYPSSVAELATIGLDATNTAYAITPAVTVNAGVCLKADYSGFALFMMSKSGQRYYVTEASSPKLDDTGTAWTSATGNLGAQCTASGYPVNLIHGYLSTDMAGGPWRAWIGGN